MPAHFATFHPRSIRGLYQIEFAVSQDFTRPVPYVEKLAIVRYVEREQSIQEG